MDGKTRNIAVPLACSNVAKQVARFTVTIERTSVVCSLTVWLTERSKERSEARVKSKSGEKRFVQDSHFSVSHAENRILRAEKPTVLQSKKKKRRQSFSILKQAIVSPAHV